MCATAGISDFGFLHAVKGSSAQEAGQSLHVGVIGSMVAEQLPLVIADPHQHPMDQLRTTFDIAWKLKQATNQLWQSIARGAEAANKLSDKCDHLHSTVVRRVPGANYPETNNKREAITNTETTAK